MRLQGAGHDVTVIEARERPGGRAYQLRDAGYTWDTGPSLVTMPWVLEETFAAAGIDLHDLVQIERLVPFYRIRWAGCEEHLDFVADRDLMRRGLAKFSARDGAAFDGFIAAMKPIYEQGILLVPDAARSSTRAISHASRRRCCASGLRCRCGARSAHTSSTRACARRSRFHSLFIGGDPFRVPAIYGALRFAAASHAARRPRLPALHPRHDRSGSGRADVLLVRARARAIGARYAIARRLLPRDVRDDVYLLYLVFRTLDDLVDTRNPSAPSRIAAVE
ncbi:MAG: phytoene desaturase, partial [Gaiellales bacterium]|nr:phytoene desaturase [Gaiellales bacterium]